MRKTRLVILPGVRSLKTIGCLLLFLACPTIAFKGQENREVEPLCKAQDLKEFWVQESPWPGDLGEIAARTTALGSRPRLDILTKHTCNLDVSNRKVREPQRASLLERRIVAERWEKEGRLDSSVVSRSRSQDNARNRLGHRREERVAEARAAMNNRLSDERRASIYRADSRVVNIRERINRENGRRDVNRMNLSNTRSLDRLSRTEDRRGRVEGDNVPQRLSRNARSMENTRDYNRVSSQQQEHEIRATTRERIDGRVRRMESRRREQNVDNNRRDMRREMRMDRDDIRDSRRVTRYTRSTEDIRRTDERVIGGIRDMLTRHADSRNENSRREVTGVERTERLDRNRVDVRRRQVDMRNTRSLEDVTRSGRQLGMIDRESRNSDRMQTRRAENDLQARNGIRQSRDTDVKGSTFSRLSEEMTRLDRTAQRVASHDFRHIESRRSGEIRRESRSLERSQDNLDVRQLNEDIRVSGILTRTVRSVQDPRRSNRIEIRQQRTVTAGSRIINDDTRDLSDGRRSVSRDEMVSRRSSSRRLNDGKSRDMRRLARQPEQTREIGQETRVKETPAVQRTIQRATDSTRIIRSEMRRSQMGGTIRIISDERETRREGGEMKRDTRSLKKLGNEYRLMNEADVRAERNERFSAARFQKNDLRSVDSLRRVVRQTPLPSYERETRETDIRRVRKYRIESRSLERDVRDTRRNMGARSSSAESRDSRAENLVRVLVKKESRSSEEDTRTVRGARFVNERSQSRVDNRIHDGDRTNDNQIRSIAMNRVDMRLSDGRFESTRNYRDTRKVESNRVENDRRDVRSLDREMSNVDVIAHRKRQSMDNRSSRLDRAHLAEDTIRRADRRAESIRLERRRFDISREVRNSASSMYHMKERQTNMRRMQINTPDIRSTESLRRSAREQPSRADRDVSRVENSRFVDDRREREIRRVNIKPADVRRTHSEDRSSRFNTGSRQLDRTHNAREETRRTDSRRDERRNAMSITRQVKSFDETPGESRKVFGTIRSAEDVASPKLAEIRQTHKDARISHKMTTAAHNAESMFGMPQKTGYYEAAKSVVTNWMATYDIKMTDVSRLGETMMFGGIACYALFANVNKKAIF